MINDKKDKEQKIVVFSDSHGSIKNMTAVMELHRDAKTFIHLGDGACEFAKLCHDYRVIGHSLLGNCDKPIFCPEAREHFLALKLCGHSFFMTHGHEYGVKWSRGVLISEAKTEVPDVDVILYGHTHTPEVRYIAPENEGEKEIYLINPGSLTAPRALRANPTYALLTFRDGKMLASIAEISEQ